jgi:hypothetical protein
MEFDLLTIIGGLAIAVYLSGLIWAGWILGKPFALCVRLFRPGRVMKRLDCPRHPH